MKTINLLPKSRQQEIHYTSLLSSLWLVVILSLLSFAVVFLAQFAVKIYLDAKSSSLSNQIELAKSQVNKNENADIKKKIEDANNVIADYNNLSDAVPKWSNVLKAFAVIPPSEVKINSLNVDPTTKIVSITGFSPTRELVIQLYNNILQDSNNFYNVDYPFENLMSPVNTHFHFSFHLRDKLLK